MQARKTRNTSHLQEAVEPEIVFSFLENFLVFLDQREEGNLCRRLEEDDETLTEVNINNMKRVSKERIRNLIAAACNSKHIQKISMANTAISDSEARVSLSSFKCVRFKRKP